MANDEFMKLNLDTICQPLQHLCNLSEKKTIQSQLIEFFHPMYLDQHLFQRSKETKDQFEHLLTQIEGLSGSTQRWIWLSVINHPLFIRKTHHYLLYQAWKTGVNQNFVRFPRPSGYAPILYVIISLYPINQYETIITRLLNTHFFEVNVMDDLTQQESDSVQYSKESYTYALDVYHLSVLLQSYSLELLHSALYHLLKLTSLLPLFIQSIISNTYWLMTLGLETQNSKDILFIPKRDAQICLILLTESWSRGIRRQRIRLNAYDFAQKYIANASTLVIPYGLSFHLQDSDAPPIQKEIQKTFQFNLAPLIMEWTSILLHNWYIHQSREVFDTLKEDLLSQVSQLIPLSRHDTQSWLSVLEGLDQFHSN